VLDTMIQSEHMYSESSLWPYYTGRINLLGLGEYVAAGEALVKLVDVVVERVVEAELAQLSQWVAARQGLARGLASSVKRGQDGVPWFCSIL
jgi:hypothetical protein